MNYNAQFSADNRLEIADNRVARAFQNKLKVTNFYNFLQIVRDNNKLWIKIVCLKNLRDFQRRPVVDKRRPVVDAIFCRRLLLSTTGLR